LVNYTEFDKNGRYIPKTTPAATPAVAEVTEVQETETAEA